MCVMREHGCGRSSKVMMIMFTTPHHLVGKRPEGHRVAPHRGDNYLEARSICAVVFNLQKHKDFWVSDFTGMMLQPCMHVVLATNDYSVCLAAPSALPIHHIHTHTHFPSIYTCRHIQPPQPAAPQPPLTQECRG
jgi:hypothetical protein